MLVQLTVTELVVPAPLLEMLILVFGQGEEVGETVGVGVGIAVGVAVGVGVGVSVGVGVGVSVGVGEGSKAVWDGLLNSASAVWKVAKANTMAKAIAKNEFFLKKKYKLLSCSPIEYF